MLLDDRQGKKQAESTIDLRESDEQIPHYYGDIVRRLFIAAGVIMILTLPFFNERIHLPPFVSLLAITVIGFIAGLINPRQKEIVAIQTVIAIVGAIAFGQYAVSAYEIANDAYFWVNLILTLIFFFSLYYSTKTLRGTVLYKN